MDSRPPLDFPFGRSLNAVTQHGFAPLLFEEHVPRRVTYVNRSLALLARYADITFTPSESEREHILERTKLDPGSVVAVHHGVDHDRFRPPLAPRATRVRSCAGGSRIDGRYVFFTANDQYKEPRERLVEAFALLARDINDVTLALAGWHTPRFQGVLDLIDSLGISARVRVLGHLGDTDLELLYGARRYSSCLRCMSSSGCRCSRPWPAVHRS